jgi:hypothetical protein
MSGVKNFLIITGMTLSCTYSHAQCEVEIPENCIEVKKGRTVAGGAKHYLVCPGTTLTLTTGLHRVYAEAGSTVEIYGGSPTVYVKSESRVKVHSGTPRIIHHDAELLDWKKSISSPPDASCEPIFISDKAHSCLVREVKELEPAGDLASGDSLVMDSTNRQVPVDISLIDNKTNSKEPRQRLSDRLKNVLQADSTGLIVMEVKIPETAIVVDGNSEMTVFKNSIYLKEGKAVITGEKNKLYVGAGAELILFGGNNTVYAKQGARVVISGMDNNKIYFEEEVDIIKELDGENVELRQKGQIVFGS